AAIKIQGKHPVLVTSAVVGVDGSVGIVGNYKGLELGNNSTIGDVATPNVFSGNVRGIQVNGNGWGSAAPPCLITGNRIGTSLAGTSASAVTGNSEAGIRIENAYA